jgi:hypothetical protein
MNARVGTIVVLAAIAAFVAGSIYVIGTRGTSLLGVEPKKVAPAEPAPQPPTEVRQPVSDPASASPVSPSMQREAAQRVRSGVYRCMENGAIKYADQPCANGREVEVPRDRVMPKAN